jgi:hypothetical protein
MKLNKIQIHLTEFHIVQNWCSSESKRDEKNLYLQMKLLIISQILGYNAFLLLNRRNAREKHFAFT